MTPLREARLAADLTQAELAEHAGLSIVTVWRVEQGAGCRHSTQVALLRALGLEWAERRDIFPSPPPAFRDCRIRLRQMRRDLTRLAPSRAAAMRAAMRAEERELLDLAARR